MITRDYEVLVFLTASGGYQAECQAIGISSPVCPTEHEAVQALLPLMRDYIEACLKSGPEAQEELLAKGAVPTGSKN